MFKAVEFKIDLPKIPWRILEEVKRVCLWNTNAFGGIKVTVKVTRSLTLVPIERVFISWVWMPNMKSLSLTVQKLWPRLKGFFFATESQTVRVTDRTTRAPRGTDRSPEYKEHFCYKLDSRVKNVTTEWNQKQQHFITHALHHCYEFGLLL